MKLHSSFWLFLLLIWISTFNKTVTASKVPVQPPHASAENEYTSYAKQVKSYLKSLLYTQKQVENWLAGRKLHYGETYHSQLGWVAANRRMKDGFDKSISTYRYSGARRMINFSDMNCRINTYGNSFTHCDQVSDGETWQEVLAAHLGEPIRNFGIGGYSVYQSYLRMKIEEARTPAPYIIFNIFDDDHYRNLHGWRNIRLGYEMSSRPTVNSPSMPYVEVNPFTQEFREFSNPCPTPESVYNLCNLDWVYKRFKNDFTLKIIMAGKNIRENKPEGSYKIIQELASQQGITTQINNPEILKQTIHALHTRAGIFASMRIVEMVEEYAKKEGRKVLYVLSFGSPAVAQTIKEGTRFDQNFIDFLDKKELPYVDNMQAHLKDFSSFNLDTEGYIKRYWIGHYNPLGNFFQAFAIKNKLVEMLDPKPVSYATNDSVYTDPETLRFPGRNLVEPKTE